MSKRYRAVTAKPGQLIAAFGRAEDASLDVQYAWGGAGASKPDARVLSEALEGAKVHDGKSLRLELEERGYDITTLKFSIARTPTGDTK